MNIHKTSIHKEKQAVQVTEMMKIIFSTICEGLVETNEQVRKLSGDMNAKLDSVIESQAGLEKTLGNIKTQVNEEAFKKKK